MPRRGTFVKSNRVEKSRNFPLALHTECGLLAITRRLNPLARRNRVAGKILALGKSVERREREDALEMVPPIIPSLLEMPR